MEIDRKLALECAQLSAESYKRHTIENHETQVFVDSDDSRLIIAFRGTEPDELEDWATDLKFRRTSTRIGSVHRGFWSAFISVWEPIYALCRDSKDKQIILTGHSLGGALATCCYAMLDSYGIKPTAVYSYGCPRVFSSESADIFNTRHKGRVFRFVNNNDIVTRVPTQHLGYSHVGQLFYIDHNGIIHDGQNLDWWSKFWARIGGRLSAFTHLSLADGIADHGIGGYIRALE